MCQLPIWIWFTVPLPHHWLLNCVMADRPGLSRDLSSRLPETLQCMWSGIALLSLPSVQPARVGTNITHCFQMAELDFHQVHLISTKGKSKASREKQGGCEVHVAYCMLDRNTVWCYAWPQVCHMSFYKYKSYEEINYWWRLRPLFTIVQNANGLETMGWQVAFWLKRWTWTKRLQGKNLSFCPWTRQLTHCS
jgi:hypothetical protein